MAMTVGDTPKPAANGVGTHAEAGAGDGGGGAEAPVYVTKADFDAWAQTFTGKIGGEIGSLRKFVKGTNGAAEAKPAAEPKPADAPLTRDEIAAQVRADGALQREIGKIEAKLPDDIAGELAEETAEMSTADAARLYRRALNSYEKGAAKAADAAKDRGGETPVATGGETPKAKSTARAATSATRDPVQHPKTVSEYLKIAKTDPKRKAALDADETFSVNQLQQI